MPWFWIFFSLRKAIVMLEKEKKKIPCGIRPSALLTAFPVVVWVSQNCSVAVFTEVINSTAQIKGRSD